jgi:hypothetical protein
MTARTTIDETEQLEIEEYLIRLGVLEKGAESDVMSLNISNLTAIMMSPDEQLIDKAKKKRKRATSAEKATKDDKIKSNLKSHLKVQNTELREAYEGWIDAIYDKQGWMSVKCVTVAETTIDAFSGHNLDVALKLLEIASIHGYRDIQWAINKYNQEFKISYSTTPSVRKVVTNNSQLSEEVF